MTADSLAALFRAHVGRAGEPPPDPELERLLSALFDNARAAWPGVTVQAPELVRHLAARLAPEGTIADALAGVHASDLYLTCACSRGDARAIAEFEKRFLSQVPAYLARLDSSSAFVDEVQQTLREKLFVSAGKEPAKIGDYSGRGALASWVRVAAVRTGLSLRRGQRERSSGDGESEANAMMPVGDAEVDYIKLRYRGEFEKAFTDAFKSLISKDRNVLRLHYIEGLNIDRIGVLYKVHRSTVARWLVAHRELLLDETRRLLRERLVISQGEFDSLMGLVSSQLDVSIPRLLQTAK